MSGYFTMHLLKTDKKDQGIIKTTQKTKPRTFPTNKGSLSQEYRRKFAKPRSTWAVSEQRWIKEFMVKLLQGE